MTPEEILEAVNLPTDWAQVNTFMLVNFLRLPAEHQRHLLESIFERVPEMFPNQWKAFPEHTPEKEFDMYLVWKEKDWVKDLWVKGKWVHTYEQSDVKAFISISNYKP